MTVPLLNHGRSIFHVKNKERNTNVESRDTDAEVVYDTSCLVMNNIRLSVKKKTAIKMNYGTFSPPVTLAAQTLLPW